MAVASSFFFFQFANNNISWEAINLTESVYFTIGYKIARGEEVILDLKIELKVQF